MSSGYFIPEWKLNFSGSWKILRIRLKIQGKFHFLESVQTFDIPYIFWGLGVGWHRTSEVYPWFGTSTLAFHLDSVKGIKKSQARPKSKRFVRYVVSRCLSNAGDHKSKLRSIELQLLTQIFRIKCFLSNVLKRPPPVLV